eukprot:gene22403-29514_t
MSRQLGPYNPYCSTPAVGGDRAVVSALNSHGTAVTPPLEPATSSQCGAPSKNGVTHSHNPNQSSPTEANDASSQTSASSQNEASSKNGEHSSDTPDQTSPVEAGASRQTAASSQYETSSKNGKPSFRTPNQTSPTEADDASRQTAASSQNEAASNNGEHSSNTPNHTSPIEAGASRQTAASSQNEAASNNGDHSSDTPNQTSPIEAGASRQTAASSQNEAASKNGEHSSDTPHRTPPLDTSTSSRIGVHPSSHNSTHDVSPSHHPLPSSPVPPPHQPPPFPPPMDEGSLWDPSQLIQDVPDTSYGLTDSLRDPSQLIQDVPGTSYGLTDSLRDPSQLIQDVPGTSYGLTDSLRDPSQLIQDVPGTSYGLTNSQVRQREPSKARGATGPQFRLQNTSLIRPPMITTSGISKTPGPKQRPKSLSPSEAGLCYIEPEDSATKMGGLSYVEPKGSATAPGELSYIEQEGSATATDGLSYHDHSSAGSEGNGEQGWRNARLALSQADLAPGIIGVPLTDIDAWSRGRGRRGALKLNKRPGSQANRESVKATRTARQTGVGGGGAEGGRRWSDGGKQEVEGWAPRPSVRASLQKQDFIPGSQSWGRSARMLSVEASSSVLRLCCDPTPNGDALYAYFSTDKWHWQVLPFRKIKSLIGSFVLLAEIPVTASTSTPAGQRRSRVSKEAAVSGESGLSGESGISEGTGLPGVPGLSGQSGISGDTGRSGETRTWTLGLSGLSGDTGHSGETRTSGFSGLSGELCDEGAPVMWCLASFKHQWIDRQPMLQDPDVLLQNADDAGWNYDIAQAAAMQVISSVGFNLDLLSPPLHGTSQVDTTATTATSQVSTTDTTGSTGPTGISQIDTTATTATGQVSTTDTTGSTGPTSISQIDTTGTTATGQVSTTDTTGSTGPTSTSQVCTTAPTGSTIIYQVNTTSLDDPTSTYQVSTTSPTGYVSTSDSSSISSATSPSAATSSATSPPHQIIPEGQPYVYRTPPTHVVYIEDGDEEEEEEEASQGTPLRVRLKVQGDMAAAQVVSEQLAAGLNDLVFQSRLPDIRWRLVVHQDTAELAGEGDCCCLIDIVPLLSGVDGALKYLLERFSFPPRSLVACGNEAAALVAVRSQLAYGAVRNASFQTPAEGKGQCKVVVAGGVGPLDMLHALGQLGFL